MTSSDPKLVDYSLHSRSYKFLQKFIFGQVSVDIVLELRQYKNDSIELIIKYVSFEIALFHSSIRRGEGKSTDIFETNIPFDSIESFLYFFASSYKKVQKKTCSEQWTKLSKRWLNGIFWKQKKHQIPMKPYFSDCVYLVSTIINEQSI